MLTLDSVPVGTRLGSLVQVPNMMRSSVSQLVFVKTKFSFFLVKRHTRKWLQSFGVSPSCWARFLQ